MANTQNLDLVKPLGTDHALVSVLNSNSDKIDAYAGAVNASLDGLRDGLGILADGNTHAAITSGQFVYVKNHQTLPQGLYQATTNIAANGTLSTSNLAADPKGGLNTLSEQIATQTGSFTNDSGQQSLSAFVRKSANIVSVRINGQITGITSGQGFNLGTLASGFRPAFEMQFTCICANNAINKFCVCLLICRANGTITVYTPSDMDSSINTIYAGITFATA